MHVMNPQVMQHLVRDSLLFQRGDYLLVGVSGGADSLCLLHVLHSIAPTLALRLHVAHLHHGLRGAEADADAACVQHVAAAWGLPCTVERADTRSRMAATGESVEEAARTLRYAFLSRLAGELGCHAVAVAHNADDQAETVLMHLLRGSGLAGLRGMTARSPLPGAADPHAVPLIRPLLPVARADINAYCTHYALQPRVDASNADTTLLRNRLRHHLLPLLEGYNPQIRRVLADSASTLADDYAWLAAQAQAAYSRVVSESAAGQVTVDLAAWRALPISLQRLLLRLAVQHLRGELRDLGYAHIESLRALLLHGRTGARLSLPAGLEAVRGYTTASIGAAGAPVPLDDVPQLSAARLALRVPGHTALGTWHATCRLFPAAELPSRWQNSLHTDPWQALLDADRIGPAPMLRWRQAGDCFQPLGLTGGHKSLADFFIDSKIPAAARARWPLLARYDGAIAWVCGLRVDTHVALHADTRQVLHIMLTKQHP